MGGVLELAGTETSLPLPPKLDAGAAHGLKASLLECRGRPLAVDASDVQQMGALCLQVLLSAQKSWRHDGLGFVVQNPSPAFRDSVALLGAETLLL
jgi:chemotaxis protein CheX